MERDFLGLTVNHHHHHRSPSAPHAGSLRSRTMEWPFPNHAPTLPHLLSFQDENVRTSFGSLTSNGLIAIPTNAFFDSNPRGGEVRYESSTYPVKQFDSPVIHHTVTTKTSLKIEPSGVHHSFVDTSRQSLSLSSQSRANVSFANPMIVVPNVENADPRTTFKIRGASTQLTIFYNGSVCVYDNISPDKAQAIMLLAGNRSSTPSSAASTKLPSTPKHPIFDQSYGRSSSNTVAAKPSGAFMSSSAIAEPLRTTMSTGSSSAKFLSSDTVPQFRKKSLARFLEKRKERVINALPYSDKEQPPNCRTV